MGIMAVNRPKTWVTLWLNWYCLVHQQFLNFGG